VAAVVALVAVAVAAWQVGLTLASNSRVASGETPLTVLIPTPSMIAQAAWENFGLIQTAMMATLHKALIGFAIGTVLAVLVAVLYAVSPVTRWLTFPLAYAFHSFPVFGLVPLIILAFGADSISGIAAIAVLLSYFPTLVTLDAALQRVAPELRELGTLWSASRLQMLRFIEIPVASPALFVGFRLAVPSSIVGATVGELLGSSSGIGNAVAHALYQLEPGLMYALLLEIAVVCAIVVGVVALAERLLLPWARGR